MLIDRCSTAGLMLMLSFFYPNWIFLWQFLTVLDISSHWMHTHASLHQGDSTHKITDLAANPIMRIYYMGVSP